jgi:hypothetical protein
MPRIRTGYQCKCGAVIILTGPGLESMAAFEEQREKQRQSDWMMMAVHEESSGGCGEGMWLTPDDIIPFEDQAK